MSDEQKQPALAGQVERSVRQHTPGPWTCFYKSKYDEWHVSVPMSQGSMKWALFDDGVRSENPEADARLIAAAPELLAALQAITNDRGTWNLMPMQLRDLAGSAIAKATVCAA